MDNKYSVYRKIRFDRTYRTLGKMSWWRIVLGIVLLIVVLLISGVVSQRLAAGGNFRAAEKLMIHPAWMEKYKPETKAFIEAGVIFQDGDFEKAALAFSEVEGVDAADAMESVAWMKLASHNLSAGEHAKAYEAVIKADSSFLVEEYAEEYTDVCSSLMEYFILQGDDESSAYAEKLAELLDNLS